MNVTLGNSIAQRNAIQFAGKKDKKEANAPAADAPKAPETKDVDMIKFNDKFMDQRDSLKLSTKEDKFKTAEKDYKKLKNEKKYQKPQFKEAKDELKKANKEVRKLEKAKLNKTDADSQELIDARAKQNAKQTAYDEIRLKYQGPNKAERKDGNKEKGIAEQFKEAKATLKKKKDKLNDAKEDLKKWTAEKFEKYKAKGQVLPIGADVKSAECPKLEPQIIKEGMSNKKVAVIAALTLGVGALVGKMLSGGKSEAPAQQIKA